MRAASIADIVAGQAVAATVSVSTELSGVNEQQAQNSGPGFANAIGVSTDAVTVTNVEAVNRRRLQDGPTGTYKVDYDVETTESEAQGLADKVSEPSFTE